MSSHRGCSGSPPSQGLENWGLKESARGRGRCSGASLLSSDRKRLAVAWRRGVLLIERRVPPRLEGDLLSGSHPSHLCAFLRAPGWICWGSGSAPEPCPTLASHLHSSSYQLDGPLAPACQLRLLNEAFAKSIHCSSTFTGSLLPKEERPNSSSVFLDNLSSPSSLTHISSDPGNVHLSNTQISSTHCVPVTLFYAGSYVQASALAVPPAGNAFPFTNPNSTQPSPPLQEPSNHSATVLAPVMHWIFLWGTAPQPDHML